MSLYTHYTLHSDGSTYPAMSGGADGYEDRNPKDWRPSTSAEINAYESNAAAIAARLRYAADGGTLLSGGGGAAVVAAAPEDGGPSADEKAATRRTNNKNKNPPPAAPAHPAPSGVVPEPAAAALDLSALFGAGNE